MRGVVRARELGAARVLLVPGDVPALAPAEVDALLARDWPPPPSVMLVADRGGHGTNALLLAPPDVIAPSFGLGSRARHRRLAWDAGVRFMVARVLTLELDVDTGADLDALRGLLAADHRGADATRAALARLDAAPAYAVAAGSMR
jgi:2-phospho-L-lactate guanylyltransferase